MAKAIGAHAKHSMGELKEDKITRLVDALKHFRLPISDYRPFEEAIVTAGGVELGEINPHTLESLKIKGLYFAGEIMDLDANTGGYNLQIAFSTGRLAGQLRGMEE
jgi:predicted flavoprotein YhiN